MKKAILATKVGMTQIFNEDGTLTPVTVLQAGPCVVTQIKTVENDGYSAVQVGFVDKKDKIVNKDKNGKKEIQLAQEGMVIVVMAMDTASGTIIAGPDLVSRGFVYVRDAEELMLEAERRVHQVLDDCEAQRIKDWTTIKQNVRDALGKFFYDKTRRRPMILPIIQDVH